MDTTLSDALRRFYARSDRTRDFVWMVLIAGACVVLLAFGEGIGTVAQHTAVAGLGVLAGFSYAVPFWSRIRSLAGDHDWDRLSMVLLVSTTGTSAVGSGLAPAWALVGIGAFALTVVVISLSWLCSPFHDGMAPADRGVRPPTSDEREP